VRGSAVPTRLAFDPGRYRLVMAPLQARAKHLHPHSFVETLSIGVSREGQTLENRSSVLPRRLVDVTFARQYYRLLIARRGGA